MSIGKSEKRLILEEGRSREKEDDAISDLVSRINGAGNAKIYRVTEASPQGEWAKSLNLDDETAANLEEKIAELCGGGKYYVKCLKGPKMVAHLTIVVDATMHAPKKTEAEKKRNGEAESEAPREDMARMIAAMAAAQERQTAQMLAMFQMHQVQQPKQPDLLALMTVLDQRAHQRSVDLLQIARGAEVPQGTARPVASPMESLKETLQLVELLRGAGFGDGGAPPSSMVEKSLGLVLPKIGEKVGDYFVKQMEAPPAPPTAGTTQTSGTPAELPPPRQAAIPKGAKPLSTDQIARIHARRNAGLSPVEAPPAPRAVDVAPEAVKKD